MAFFVKQIAHRATAKKSPAFLVQLHNKVLENSQDEEVNYSISHDNGKIWSNFILGETDEKFCDLGIALDERFWPMWADLDELK